MKGGRPAADVQHPGKMRGTVTKAGVYARVSSDRQESANQLAELREYCARRGWEIAHEYVDEDVRGTDRGPQLEAFLRDAHKRRFDVAVFWALDRLTRAGLKDAIECLYRLSGSGVEFVSYQEEYLTSFGPWRDAVVGLIATMANVETQRMSERIRAGIARARAEGRKLGRPVRAYPVEPAVIVQERAAGASWGALARKYRLPRSSARRLYQKALAKKGTPPEGKREAF